MHWDSMHPSQSLAPPPLPEVPPPVPEVPPPVPEVPPLPAVPPPLPPVPEDGGWMVHVKTTPSGSFMVTDVPPPDQVPSPEPPGPTNLPLLSQDRVADDESAVNTQAPSLTVADPLKTPTELEHVTAPSHVIPHTSPPPDSLSSSDEQAHIPIASAPSIPTIKALFIEVLLAFPRLRS
jgi:hypothetical protein